MRNVRTVIVAAMLLTIALGAHAGTVIYNESFNGPGGQPQYVTIYNECHGPTDGRGPWGDGTFFPQAFCDYPFNQTPEYGYPDIGRYYEPQAWVYFSTTVTLLSVDASYGARIRSSRGGEVWVNGPTFCLPSDDPAYDPGCVPSPATAITDPLFTDIEWITICGECGLWYEIGMYDNIRYSVRVAQVPEPSTLELIAWLVGGLTFRWKFKRHF